MPSQDDDSEEVSVNSLHDVMALMTRRFELLLVRQEERQARMFAEQFEVPFDKIGRSIDNHRVIVDFTEQTLSLCVETSMRKCEVDGISEHLEREAPTYTEGGHSEASVQAAVPEAKGGKQQRREPGERLAEKGDDGERAIFADIDVHIATQEMVAREQSTDAISDGDRHMSVLHNVPVKLGEALSWQLESYKMTITGRHTPDMRSVNSVQGDNPGVDVAGLVEKIVYPFWVQVGVG